MNSIGGVSLKTTFTFLEGMDKRRVTIKPKNIFIGTEVRDNHLETTDSHGNRITRRVYIVIRIPKSTEINPPAFTMNWMRRTSVGYILNDLTDCFEMLFFYRITFGWYAYELEQMKGVKVTQRIVPDYEYGELFPCYFNPKGFKQWSFNLLFGFIQLPFIFYKERQAKKREASMRIAKDIKQC
jgi:hypothetical protein